VLYEESNKKNTEKIRYRDARAPFFFSLPTISGSHSGEDGTDFSTWEKKENLGTNINLSRFKDIFTGSVDDGAKGFCIRSRIIIILNNFNI
jgi:hypothetical protein